MTPGQPQMTPQMVQQFIQAMQARQQQAGGQQPQGGPAGAPQTGQPQASPPMQAAPGGGGGAMPTWPENTGNIGGNTTSTTEKTLPKFAIGSQVRVKKGVTAPNHTDMSLGGWCGKVYQVSGTVCLVHWSEATLKAIHPNHHERWQRDGVDFRVMWPQYNVLEVDPGEPLCIEHSNGELR